VDVEQRLLADATSFTKEVASLDEEGFIDRTLAVLGIPPKNSNTISETEEATPETGRTQRPAPAGDTDPGLIVKNNVFKH
jgi:hypothetical protein